MMRGVFGIPIFNIRSILLSYPYYRISLKLVHSFRKNMNGRLPDHKFEIDSIEILNYHQQLRVWSWFFIPILLKIVDDLSSTIFSI